MKTPPIRLVRGHVIALCFWLVLPLHAGAAQFVEVSAEIQTVYWSEHSTNVPSKVEIKNSTIHCVVGTNTWLIAGDFEPAQQAWWFTGSNIVAQTVLTGYPSERPVLFHENHPDIILGKRYTRAFESPDGRPVPSSPALAVGTAFGEAGVRIPWLAFCCGPYLKQVDSRLPLLRIEEFNFALDYSVKATVFPDDLGLPRNVDFTLPSGQPVFQYRVLESTNVLGWTIPTQFHLVQYRKAHYSARGEAGGWEVDFTATGKLISIGVGSEPKLPADP